MSTGEKKVIKNKKKIAFVASGGAIKASCFHIGVMLAMERFGFSFVGGKKEDSRELITKPGQVSVYVGSSAGAFVASLIAGGFSPNELYGSLSGHKNKKSTLRPIIYFDVIGNNIISNITSTFNSWIRTTKYKHFSIEGALQSILGINGLFNTKNVGKYISAVMPTNDFKELIPELYIVTTELDNPNRIILGSKELYTTRSAIFDTDVNISDAAIGSMSLPFIFGPYKLTVKGKKVYVFDGEVRHTLSNHIAKDAGADLIIASYTHQPYVYNEEYGSLINYGLTSIMVQTIYQLVESRIKESRSKHIAKQNAIDEVTDFFEEKKLPKELLNELLDRMYKKIDYDPNVDYIYISPDPNDSNMFFEDHFNLSTRSMGKIIRSGFKSAYQALSQYEFDFTDTEFEFLTEENNLWA
ncbi:MAG: patatin-like phospholipase family protein [Candidatus Sericytochromatia bacterium]|nr:patatin-like phospholipase family protein [Candidatus Sericytochromatia bacterium]